MEHRPNGHPQETFSTWAFVITMARGSFPMATKGLKRLVLLNTYITTGTRELYHMQTILEGCRYNENKKMDDKKRVIRAGCGFLKTNGGGAPSSLHSSVLALGMVEGGGGGITDQSQTQNRACAVL
jgi:hypothetical protein